MRLTLILIPYYLGQERIGMGLGPERFIQGGISRDLSSQGHDVVVETVQCVKYSERGELVAVAEINALLAAKVCAALRQRRFPFILAGNCNSCLGTLAGLRTQMVGIIWLDAHGDFNRVQLLSFTSTDALGKKFSNDAVCHDYLQEFAQNRA
jgi:arginase